MPRRAAPKRRKQAINPGHFDVTPDLRRKVEALISWGYEPWQIARLIINPKTGRPITTDTLKRYFEYEIEVGLIKTSGVVIETMLRKATGNPTIIDPATGIVLLQEREPDQRAMETWLKRTMGWSNEPTQPPAANTPLVIVVEKEEPEDDES